ncbi:hypothetical protein [Actinoplanes couchii]|uniref:Nephrocystin 3-like N-terminal domain-containing protein n=1 Tax=Actinoplanes couchii TaxID=403638 RepID=A0ABQ3XHB8_9ACTN|nr:hypothetical protein [Actinoplanes couchii]MDR6317510.1 tetratricopeptide (TPR) repeat protein [Actinoplanes couchii]GID57892.1 hypothetical protein Aco03nite_062960 [Actinoplanes couchii]
MDTDDAAAFVDISAGHGVQLGSGNVQNNLFASTPPSPPVRSAYRERIREIIRDHPRDREPELAELADFCTTDHDQQYAWWRAPAWAGKSALMAWFALNPPPGVRIVAFFIRALHHRQNDRQAFLDNVIEQLAEILELHTLPPTLNASTREAHLTTMLTEASTRCQAAGDRLILLVDGLDEDRGVTAHPDSHSIAGALPHHPPAGLRVIVSSRPNPPLPADVPPGHPLRARCLRRDLEPSIHAEFVRRDAERELKAIVHDGGLPARILGLVTASHGGLSATDLAELTGQDQWLVEDHLAAFTGRSFDLADTVYVLAHKELQETATTLVGESRLTDHRRRLNEWADSCLTPGRSAGTPEFLLHGYFTTLHEQGDIERIKRLVLDDDRRTRILERVGGDSTVLDEITLTQEGILQAPEPDLPTMCRLALLRRQVIARNQNMPLDLPRLWAMVGDLPRAEALIRAMPEDGGRRALATTWLAPAVAAAGDHDRAVELIGQIPHDLFADENQPSKAISEVVHEMTENNETERAKNLARTISRPFWRSQAMGQVAIALGKSSKTFTEAESLAREVTEPYWRAQLLGILASSAARQDDRTTAQRLLGEALDVADLVPHGAERSRVYTVLALESRSWQPGDEPAHLASRAVDEATGIADPTVKVEALATVAKRLADMVAPGVSISNDQLAEAVRGNEPTVGSLSAMALAWYTAGDADQAIAVADLASSRADRHDVLRAVIAAAAAADDFDCARSIAESITDVLARDRAIARIASQLRRAEDTLEELVQSIQDPATRASALTGWGYRAASRGDRKAATALAARAEATARSALDNAEKAQLLTRLVPALVTLGSVERARKAAAQAHQAFRSLAARSHLDPVMAELVRAAAEVGVPGTSLAVARLMNAPRIRAEALCALATTVTTPDHRAEMREILAAAEQDAAGPERSRTLRMILTALWVTGESAAARELAHRLTVIDDGRRLVRASMPTFPAPQPADPEKALVEAVAVLAEKGAFDRAGALVHEVILPNRRDEAHTALAKALARAGQYSQARSCVDRIQLSHRRDRAIAALAGILVEQGSAGMAEELAGMIAGEFERARTMLALAPKVESDRARRLLLVAVRHGELRNAVELLSALSPDSIRAVADELLGPDQSAG